MATGSLLDTAIKAADALERDGVSAEIINIATVKPLDRELIAESAGKTGRVVVMEVGASSSAAGSAVAAALSTACPVPMRYIGMEDCFGQSGDAADLMRYYGMTAENTVAKVKELL